MTDERTASKHPALYHYTTYGGFQGILRSQTLWAKYFKYLNDRSEVFHVYDRLYSVIYPQIKKFIQANRRQVKRAIKSENGISGLAQHEARAALDSIFAATFGTEKKRPMFPPYITSFCSHVGDDDGYTRENGLLSMWRGYGRDGGVAIIFDTAKLEKVLEIEANAFHYSYLSIGDVVYEGRDDRFIEEFGPFAERLKVQIIPLLIHDDSFHVTAEFVIGFLGAATRYKHRAFVEEREVRIVASPWTADHVPNADELANQAKQIRQPVFRRGVEYVDLFKESGAGPLPITGVIIGPHDDQAARLKEARELLKNRPDIEETCSATPYTELAPT